MVEFSALKSRRRGSSDEELLTALYRDEDSDMSYCPDFDEPFLKNLYLQPVRGE